MLQNRAKTLVIHEHLVIANNSFYIYQLLIAALSAVSFVQIYGLVIKLLNRSSSVYVAVNYAAQ